MDSESSLQLQFPCNFPLRVIGEDPQDFQDFVLQIIRKHVPELEDGAVQTHFSSGGKYLSVNVSFMAQSRAQVDSLYIELSSHKRVRFIL